MAKIFLTGGTGFIGGHLLHRLVKDGHTVIAHVRPASSRLRELQARLQKLALSREKKIDGYIENTWVRQPHAPVNLGVELTSGLGLLPECDVVYHLAGVHPDVPSLNGTHMANAAFTEKLLQSLRKGQRLVFLSNACVMSTMQDTYTVGKRTEENMIASSSDDYCIVRSGVVYGPNDRQHLWLFQAVAGTTRHWSLPIYPPVIVCGTGRNLQSVLYIDDLIEQLIGCGLNKGQQSGALSLCSQNVTSLEFLKAVVLALDRERYNPIVWSNVPEMLRNRLHWSFWTRTAEARTLRHATLLAAGLKQTVDWYRSERLL